MAITFDPSQKHAFLFSGSMGDRYKADLKNVFDLLTGYYNYPKGNIYVVTGDTLPSSADFPDAVRKVVSNLNGTADTDFEKHLKDFISAGDIADHTMVIYFTGVGSVDTLDCDNGLVIDSTSLGTILMDIDNTNAYAHVICQHDYAGCFEAAYNNISCGGRSFTAACSDAEQSEGDTTGSYFTAGWVSALKFEKRGTVRACDLSPKTDTYPAATDAGLYINMGQACNFATATLADHLCDDTPVYTPYGTVTPYLGIPKLYVRDSAMPYWWESPDIWLTRLDATPPTYPDAYDCDDLPVGYPATPLDDPDYTDDEGLWIYNNIINLRVWNIGTSPLRIYSLAAELWRTGLGQSNKQETMEDIVPNKSGSGILLPEDRADVDAGSATNSSVIGWNYPFYDGIVHQCVCVEAEEKKTDLDFNWMLFQGTENDKEAQRNLDPDPLYPPPPEDDFGGDTGTGTGDTTIPPQDEPENIPEEPENGTEAESDDSGGGSESGAGTFRGIKEHIYAIRNPFDKPRKFIIRFPDNYLNYRKYMVMDWYRLRDGKEAKPQLIEPKIKDNRIILPLELDKGEVAKFLVKLRANSHFRKMEKVKFPFNVLVEEKKKLPVGFKLRRSDIAGTKSITGFTVVTWPESATIEGRVLNERRKPMAGERIRIETGNGLRWINLKTDKYGMFRLINISPDIYRLRIGPEKRLSKDYLLNMMQARFRKIELKVSKAGKKRAVKSKKGVRK